ncbi:TIM barrel protein [candidate division KSB1 bacterium]|nr:TIM barrel protein [candidate division KSB1 bacterium]
MTYALSTSWQSTEPLSGMGLVDIIEQTGVEAIELDYRVTAEQWREMQKPLRQRGIRVASLHACTPLPENFDKKKASGDLFLLSSRDEEERRFAVKKAIQSLQLAADLQTQAVVFHLGRVEMEDQTNVLKQFYHDNEIESEGAAAFMQQKLAERTRLAPPYFDQVLKSLERMNEEACRLDVYIGIENRYRYHEIPFKSEFDTIFTEFTGGNLRYWHDTGHGEIFQRLRVLDARADLLQPYKPLLLGMHLHDIKGLKDHHAPGTGDFDFNQLKPFFRPETVRILEIHKQASLDEIQQGVQLLQEIDL